MKSLLFPTDPFFELKSPHLGALFLRHLFRLLPAFVHLAIVKKNQWILVVESHALYRTAYFLKRYTHLQMHQLVDVTAVDFPLKPFRFEVVYQFLTLTFNNRLRLKTCVHELVSLHSLSLLYLSASWFERELWDLFGVYFLDHFRLRRILTDYGFTGYPLRKEFPTGGFLEVRYDEKTQKVLYEKVQFTSVQRFSYQLW